MKAKRFLKELIRQEWRIGFIMNPIEDVIEGRSLEYRWISHNYKSRWFADPFILDVDDDYVYILAEDFEYEKNYACISKLTVDRSTCKIVDVKKILDDGTHMSFPVIVRKGNDIFVHPENSCTGCLKLYKYDRDKEKLEFISVLSDIPLTDAVTLNKDATSTMLATRRDTNPNGNKLSVLELKESKYEEVRTIQFDSNIARMAGDVFKVKGKLYRPGQDCNEYYGGALIIQEMIFKNGEYFFKTIRRLTSPHTKMKTGLHTFNMYKDVIVVDIHGFVSHPRFSSIIYSLKNKLFH